MCVWVLVCVWVWWGGVKVIVTVWLTLCFWGLIELAGRAAERSDRGLCRSTKQRLFVDPLSLHQHLRHPPLQTFSWWVKVRSHRGSRRRSRKLRVRAAGKQKWAGEEGKVKYNLCNVCKTGRRGGGENKVFTENDTLTRPWKAGSKVKAQ